MFCFFFPIIAGKSFRYESGLNEYTERVKWMWSILSSLPNEDKILFLRFVSGRSRLPNKVGKIDQRFRITSGGNRETNALPTAQTCFFQIKLPLYSSESVLKEKLCYAFRNCRSIDTDTYMLNRGDNSTTEDDEDDDDDDDDSLLDYSS